MTIAQLAADLRSRRCSSEELTGGFLERIETLDTRLNSFITVTPEQALAQARRADRLLASAAGGPLTGIPIAHKDLFCTVGIKTTAGSRMLDNFVAPYSATVVEKLADAGAVTLGKTNMDEFAMGSSSESSYYGPVRNPWDVAAVPGGSSGGSAAAVAAELCVAATGTDTGGSIRQPAALCGVTGIKPTYGRVSRWGIVAFASSLDQAGVLARSAEDAALVLQAMAGFDERDSTSAQRAVETFSDGLDRPLDGLRVGLPREYFADGLDNATAVCVQAALQELCKQGARLVDIGLPSTRLAVPAYYVLAPAEASSNLARYDGVRFGYRCEAPRDLEDLYTRSRGEGFGAEVKRRIMVGTYVLSAGYYEAYYLRAQKVRRLISEDFLRAFEQVDVIAGPTSPTPAFDLGERVDDPVTMYLSDVFTVPTSLAGLPAVSVPAGFSQRRPVGLQLIADYFQETRLLNVAHRLQMATDCGTHVGQSSKLEGSR